VPEEIAVDVDTTETPMTAEAPGCTKRRFLHVANFSFVGKLECVNGVCPNGCWGWQCRTSGFACDYAADQPDRVATRAGDAPFASYNEIKSLHASDAVAVANCKRQSGGRRLRTYAVWNGTGWDNEGITAAIRFAELYGPQDEATPHFWRWYNGYRGAGWSPMTNISPETFIDATGVKRTVARLCSATRTGWLGIYFYDDGNSGGAGMSAWKREAIIRGMNYCTTH
jgi:hypothetical protein